MLSDVRFIYVSGKNMMISLRGYFVTLLIRAKILTAIVTIPMQIENNVMNIFNKNNLREKKIMKNEEKANTCCTLCDR